MLVSLHRSILDGRSVHERCSPLRDRPQPARMRYVTTPRQCRARRLLRKRRSQRSDQRDRSRIRFSQYRHNGRLCWRVVSHTRSVSCAVVPDRFGRQRRSECSRPGVRIGQHRTVRTHARLPERPGHGRHFARFPFQSARVVWQFDMPAGGKSQPPSSRTARHTDYGVGQARTSPSGPFTGRLMQSKGSAALMWLQRRRPVMRSAIRARLMPCTVLCCSRWTRVVPSA